MADQERLAIYSSARRGALPFKMSRSPGGNQRVSSVDHLEKVADLQKHIIKGSVDDFRKCLASFPYSLDALYPFQSVRWTLSYLGVHGRPFEDRAPESLCLLHVAASRGRPDVLQLLLTSGASPNVLDSNGESALHHAATNPGSFRALSFHSHVDRSMLVARWTGGSHRCVEILCSAAGIDVNISSRHDGATPLHRACEAGREASVTELLAHGANPCTLNDFGETPAAMSLIAGHEEVFRLFLELGIIQGKPDAIPYILHTSVNAYTESPTPDKFDIILDILRLRVDLNEQDLLGNTPLHYAAAGFLVDFRLVSLLLSRGSDADVKNKMGRTPLVEFFFSHQNHTNGANIKSVLLLAAYMTTTPMIPPGQGFVVAARSAGTLDRLRPGLYRDITAIIREVSVNLPSLGHLCRQALRRAVRPHRLGVSDVINALPLPTLLKNDVANRADPESYCGHLVDYLHASRPGVDCFDILNYQHYIDEKNE